jgi:hypothetical protein
MIRPLWQLLMEDSSDLTCDECFALMQHYAELLAGGEASLLPLVIKRLKGCPNCEAQYGKALSYLLRSQSEASVASQSNVMESDRSGAEEKGHMGDCTTGIVGCRAVKTARIPIE